MEIIDLKMIDGKRNYGADLLRIIAMLMVIMLHVTEKGGFLDLNNIIGIEAWILYAISVVSVNCFVLITGYFMSSKVFRLHRVVSLWSDVVVYTLIMTVIMGAIGVYSVNIRGLIHSVMPFTFKTYWFINSYILLLFISPALNVIINNISFSQYRMLVFILVFFWCILNNFLKITSPIDSSEGFGIEWFIVLYMVGAYIKLYRKKISNIHNIYIYILCSLMIVVLHMSLSKFGDFISIRMVASYNDILVYISSVSLFLFFINLEINNIWLKKIITFLTPGVFPAYLIHHAPSVREWLYTILNTDNFIFNNNAFIIIAVLIVSCIFVISVLISKIKIFVFNKLGIDQYIYKISTNIEKRFEKWFI